MQEKLHHETSDVDIGGIFRFGAGLLVVAVIVHLLIFGLFRYFESRENARVPAEYPLRRSQRDRRPPEPRLQTDPRQELSDLRAKEDQRLGSYGRVARNAAVGRTPIEAATKLSPQW